MLSIHLDSIFQLGWRVKEKREEKKVNLGVRCKLMKCKCKRGCSQFTYSYHGHESLGNIGLSMISLNCSFSKEA